MNQSSQSASLSVRYLGTYSIIHTMIRPVIRLLYLLEIIGLLRLSPRVGNKMPFHHAPSDFFDHHSFVDPACRAAERLQLQQLQRLQSHTLTTQIRIMIDKSTPSSPSPKPRIRRRRRDKKSNRHDAERHPDVSDSKRLT